MKDSIASYLGLRRNRHKIAAVIVMLLLLLNAFGIYRGVLFPDPKAHGLILEYAVLTVLFLTAFAGVTFLLLQNKLKTECVFLITMLCIGTIYMFLMTPGSIPDEPAHFDTAYRYSNVLLGEKYTLGDIQGNGTTRLDGMEKRVDDITVLAQFEPTPNLKDYDLVASQLFKRAADTTMVRTIGYNVGLASIDYLPVALGFTLARLQGLSSVALYMWGRLFNLLFFTICVFWAIRKIPFGKMVLFSVALLPMTVQQAASLSYDAVVMGLSFLFIGYCLYVAFGKQKLRYRQLIILAVISALLAPSKIVYAFFCLLCLMIPKEKFKDLKGPIHSKSIYVFLLIFLSAVTFWIFNYAVIGNAVHTSGQLSNSSTPAYTLSFLLDHPGKAVSVIFFTMQDKFSFYLTTMLGSNLGWLNVNVPYAYILAFSVILVLSDLKEEDEGIGLKCRDKCLIGVVVCLVFAATCAAMLLSWTPITSRAVEGVQGRYFLPILPLVLLLFRNGRIVWKGRMHNILIYFIWLTQLLTVASVFQIMAI